MTKLATLLQLQITDSAIEKWEKNLNHPTEENRSKIIALLGFNPES